MPRKSLDLHGVHHEDVERTVIRFVEENWRSNEEIEIITGDSSRMRDIVSTVLSEYQLDFRLDQSYTKIYTTLE